ncbi:hypothetical protein EV361DRAFT_892560 [Lentinula raphanica]|nr:hypothetical protein EV361DRAFT_892560 [Lentinula raphanica]
MSLPGKLALLQVYLLFLQEVGGFKFQTLSIINTTLIIRIRSIHSDHLPLIRPSMCMFGPLTFFGSLFSFSPLFNLAFTSGQLWS